MYRTGIRVVFLTSAIFLALIPTAGNANTAAEELNLIPVPERITLNKGKLTVDSTFSATLTGKNTPDLNTAVDRFMKRLRKHTGIPINSDSVSRDQGAVLEIFCKEEGKKVQTVDADESYTLEISETNAHLSASTPLGVYRGLETLIQLVDLDAQSFYLPALKIEDRPRFRWRGLLIDVARHFQTVGMIKKNLEAMAAVKMNVLHWHLSDDQGFRVESKTYPKLHRMGSDGKYYTQNEIREVVAFARELGIRIVPEFDMPGHSTSWLVAYPELASAPGPYLIERQWGVFEPCLDPTKEEVYEFLDAFIAEMAGLFPDDYFHIGGDEVKSKQWNTNPDIRNFMAQNNLADIRDLQSYFNRRLLKILAKHGKKMIGWDEIFHPGLPRDIVIQSWRGQSSLSESARQGYNGILSNGYYLDHMRPASFHYGIDPLGNEASGFSEQEKSRILGGEACMWAEFVNFENIESRIWPRTAAIAERFWSPAAENDIEDLYRRLDLIDREFVLLGLNHRSLYRQQLQRMAGNSNIEPLLLFADLMKPPSLAVRKRARTYFSHTPLNRLVDALMPESKVARQFSALVEEMLNDPAGTAAKSTQVRAHLNRWISNDAALQPLQEQSCLLQETRPLAEILVKLCEAGIEAIEALDSGRKPPKEWEEKADALIGLAEKPHAEMYIAVLPPIQELIEAAQNIP